MILVWCRTDMLDPMIFICCKRPLYHGTNMNQHIIAFKPSKWFRANMKCSFRSFDIVPEWSKNHRLHLSLSRLGRLSQTDNTDRHCLCRVKKKKLFSWSVGSHRQAGRRLQRRASWQRYSEFKCCPVRSKEREKVRPLHQTHRHTARHQHKTTVLLYM